jgi:plastocyanin
MKFDITKMPVLEAVIGFLLLVTILTFVLAFKWVNDQQDDGEEEVTSETPAPTDGAPSGNQVSVTMLDNSFDPDQITVPAAQEITFDLVNEGSAIHNMVISGADGEYDTDDDAVSDPDIVNGGDEAVLTWTSPAEAGDIDFRCAFHPDVMTGTITVQ